MTLEVLSSIKGATSSQAVEKLFQTIKEAHPDMEENEILESVNQAVALETLRDDEVIESADDVKNIIKGNFPKVKNGYLVVSKVIED